MDSLSGLSLLSLALFVLIIFPGIVFKRFVYRGAYKHQFGTDSFADRIISSVLWGTVIQIITYACFTLLIENGFIEVDSSASDNITRLVSKLSKFISKSDSLSNLNDTSKYFQNDKSQTIRYSSDTTQYQTKSVLLNNLIASYKHLRNGDFPSSWINVSATIFFAYIVMNLLIAGILGFIAYWISCIFFKGITHNNIWDDYFSGYLSDKRKKIVYRVADVCVDRGYEGNKLFKGIISKYEVQKNGSLDFIVLRDCKRYCDTSKEFKDVPGAYMIIPYSKILDLNITYRYRENSSDKSYIRIVKIIVDLINITTLLSLVLYVISKSDSVLMIFIGLLLSMLIWVISVVLLVTIRNMINGTNKVKEGIGSALIILVLGLIIFSTIMYLIF